MMDSLRRSSVPRPVDNGDPRIPMAWRHRDMTFNGPYSHRPSSPSVTSSSSDDRDEVPIVRPHYRPHSRHSNMERPDDRMDHYATIRNERLDGYTPRGDRNDHHHYSSSSRSDRIDAYSLRTAPVADYFLGHSRHGNSSGTLRSTRSVPALAYAAAMEGSDSCPIHGGGSNSGGGGGGGSGRGGMRRHGSLFDIRAPPLHTPPNFPGLEKKAFHGSKHSIANGHPPPLPPPHFHPFHPHHEPPQYLPPHMLNPMMRPPPHHLGIPMMMEPVPFNKLNLHRQGPPGYPTKDADPYSVEQVCCKGHLIVLWIILGVVTVGVILGIIMGVTIT